MRGVWTFFSVLCAATLLTEGLGLALLWYRGQLTAETLENIQAALQGETESAEEGAGAAAAAAPSAEEVMRARTTDAVRLQTREETVRLLRELVDRRAKALDLRREEFESSRDAFEKRLAEITKRVDAESTEQAQAILAAEQPAEGVRHLMQLSLEENVVLLRGLREKTIARILQEFAESGDEEVNERGRAIFEAISRGEPKATLLDETQQGLDGADAAPENATPE